VKRILVVDDERPVVDGIALIVGRDLAADFEVVGTASSGKEAIERAPALTPDIVLMDVRMPGISGLDAIRELRRRGSDAAFVLVTAYERFDIAREAVELGVLGYLLKPVARDDLNAEAAHAAAQLGQYFVAGIHLHAIQSLADHGTGEELVVLVEGQTVHAVEPGTRHKELLLVFLGRSRIGL